MKTKWMTIGTAAAVVSGLSLTLAPTVSAASANPYSQPETISIAFPGNGSAGYEYSSNDPMIQFLQKKFNVTFKFVTETWSNFDSQPSLWAASGQLPDIFFSDNYYNATTYNQWIKSGVIQALPGNVTSYPYLAKILKRPDVQALKLNGKFYFWPLSLGANNLFPGDRGVFVRKDWLQKLGLTNEPATWNDFVTMLKDFVNKNPDHETNVVGLTANNEGFLQDMLWNVFPTHGYWEKEGGRWIPGWTDPKMMNIVNDIHQLYSQGLLDKDFSNGNNPYITKFVNGQAGAIVFQPKNINQVETAWNQAHPKEPFTKYVEPLIMPPGPNGKRYIPEFYDYYGGEFINASADSTKMQRILAIFNYLLSPSGQKLTQYGFEGKDWTMAKGKIKSLHPAGWDPTKEYPSIYTWQFLADWGLTKPGQNEFPTVGPVENGGGSDPATWKMIGSYYNWAYKHEVSTPINWAVNSFTYTLPAVTANTGDWFSQAVASNNPEQVWRKAVTTWMTGGGSQQINIVSKKYAKANN